MPPKAQKTPLRPSLPAPLSLRESTFFDACLQHSSSQDHPRARRSCTKCTKARLESNTTNLREQLEADAVRRGYSADHYTATDTYKAYMASGAFDPDSKNGKRCKKCLKKAAEAEKKEKGWLGKRWRLLTFANGKSRLEEV